MKIELAKLTLRNFKGQEFIEVNFGKVTTISGDNGTKKSTILDAYLWLLKNKNSRGETKFEIKNTVKKELNKGEHSVEAEYNLDGSKLVIKKVLTEVWSSKRGESEKYLSSHNNRYWWDLSEISETEFNRRVNSLIDDKKFLLLTDPLYMCTDKTGWGVKERRKTLFELVEKKSFLEIAGQNKDYLNIIEVLHNRIMKTTSIPEDMAIYSYKDELRKSILFIDKNLEGFESRFDEVKRQFPSEEPNYDAVLLQIGTLNREISELDAKIADISKANESENTRKMAVQNEIHRINTKISELEFEAKRKANEQNNAKSSIDTVTAKQRELDGILQQNDHLATQIKWHNDEITKLENETVKLRAKYAEEDAKTFTFDSLATTCPACQQSLPQSKIIESQENFTRNFLAEKKKILNNIRGQGVNNNNLIASLDAKHKALFEEFDSNTAKVSKLKEELGAISSAPVTVIPFESLLTEEHKSLSIEVYRLQESLKQFTETTTSSTELVEQRNAKSNLIPDLKVKLSVKDSIQKSNDRIKELENEQRVNSQEKANIQKIQDNIDSFIKKWISETEQSLNLLFNNKVSFEMFKMNMNGSVDEICDCIYEGKSWGCLSNGERICAGIHIINTLSKHYNFYAPIWIDNRESTTSIPETESQVINLTVVAGSPLTVK